MDYNKEQLNEIFKRLIEGLEEVIENEELEDEYEFYATLLPEEVLENYDDNSPEDALAREGVKHAELIPLMRRIVELVTQINTSFSPLWLDEENHAAGSIARELALANKDDIILYARYLSTNDLNHEVYQAEDIDEILSKWSYGQDVYPLVVARWLTPGQHRYEQGLEKTEISDEKTADVFVAAAAKWFIEGWFEPYSPKKADPRYFNAYVKPNLQELFEMLLANIAGKERIEQVTDNFINAIYGGKISTLKDLLTQADYLKDVPEIKETMPIIIDEAEFKKRGLDKGDIEKESAPKFYLFYDYNITNPFIREFIEEQWLSAPHMNGQRWNHYRVLKLGKYYVDLVNVPCNYGLALFDGKNEPLVLYGILDYMAIVRKYFKEQKGIYEDEAFRKEIKETEKKYVMFLPPAHRKKEVKMPKSEEYYDKLNDSIIIDKDYNKALKLINGMDKKAPEYPASIMDKMIVMEVKENWTEAIKACNELVTLIPELADYWKAKAEEFKQGRSSTKKTTQELRVMFEEKYKDIADEDASKHYYSPSPTIHGVMDKLLRNMQLGINEALKEYKKQKVKKRTGVEIYIDEDNLELVFYFLANNEEFYRHPVASDMAEALALMQKMENSRQSTGISQVLNNWAEDLDFDGFGRYEVSDSWGEIEGFEGEDNEEDDGEGFKKYLEFSDDKSNKFWSIELYGNSFTVQYGKVGADGQTQTKEFASEDEAEKEALKLYNSKIKKGYEEV